MNTTVQLPTSVTTGDIIQLRSGGKWETWQVANEQGHITGVDRRLLKGDTIVQCVVKNKTLVPRKVITLKQDAPYERAYPLGPETTAQSWNDAKLKKQREREEMTKWFSVLGTVSATDSLDDALADCFPETMDFTVNEHVVLFIRSMNCDARSMNCVAFALSEKIFHYMTPAAFDALTFEDASRLAQTAIDAFHQTGNHCEGCNPTRYNKF